MYKLGINFDEISDDLSISLKTMSDIAVKYGELRTVDSKNFIFWNDKEVQDFKLEIAGSGIELVAAATPLFKWYDNENDPDVRHDNYGFNPRLTLTQKREVIEKTILVASQLGIKRLRIFSGLGAQNNAGREFANSSLLKYALELADQHDLDLYLENEVVCKIHTKHEIIEFLKANTSPRLKLWLDVANLVEVGEDVDTSFIDQVASRLHYVHVKDYVLKSGTRVYVPVGQGDIDYKEIISSIYHKIPGDIVITVETHARSHKVKSSVESIMGIRQILKVAGVKYD